MRKLLVLFAVAVAAAYYPVPACSHAGDVDGYGCHLSPLHEGYHCHSGPLAGRSFMTRSEAMTAAILESEANRPDGDLVPMFQRVLAELGLMSTSGPSCR